MVFPWEDAPILAGVVARRLKKDVGALHSGLAPPFITWRMTMYSALLTEIDETIGLVTLNRPERQNMLDATLIDELTEALLDLQAAPSVRVVILSAEGAAFCAGLDPSWLRRAQTQRESEALRDERQLVRLLSTLADLPKPTIARVHAPVQGVGLALVAACDLAIAAYDAHFSISDLRQGRLPAAALPFLISALGERQARRYVLTGERFSAAEAYRLGLLHEVVPGWDELDAAIGEWIDALLRGGPQAQAEAKALLRVSAGQPLDEATFEEAARRGSRVCMSLEGREGLSSLIERRSPNWLTLARSEEA